MDEKDVIDILVRDWKNERPELDPSSMEVVGRILMLGKTLEKRANETLYDMGICYSDLDVLATLRRSGHPYALTPTQLMKSVLITSGAMTALLDRLTKLKLIYRTADEKDRRIKRAVLTEQGLQTINKAIEIRFQEAHDAIDALKNSEQKELAQLLKKLVLALPQA